MASRQQAAYKMHRKALKKKFLRKQQSPEKPYLCNYAENLEIYVTKINDLKAVYLTRVIHWRQKDESILSIVCPECKNKAKWNLMWGTFDCIKCKKKFEPVKKTDIHLYSNNNNLQIAPTPRIITNEKQMKKEEKNRQTS